MANKPLYTGKPWLDRMTILVGSAKAKAWFHGADLSGKTLIVKSAFKRDRIKNNFAKELKIVGIEDVVIPDRLKI